MSAGEFEPLKEKLLKAFKRHVEKQSGLIAGPDRLLEDCLAAVDEWLLHDQEQWDDQEACVSEALRDLRVNQMR